jgi:hypothetical protein
MAIMRQFRVGLHQKLALMTVLLALLGPTTFARAASEPGSPCGLLTAAEVEAVLAEPLAGPPYRASGVEPSAAGDTCRYETASFRAVTVGVDWTQGGELFGLMGVLSDAADAAGLKGVLTLSDGTALHGAWDQAREFMCCQLHALLGDRQVVIDIAATKATLAQAAGLADKAVQRLEQPLQVDASVGISEAVARGKARPPIASACTLVSRAEAETLAGAKLASDPSGNENGCTYAWVEEGSDYEQPISLAVTWRDGFGEFRRTQAAIGLGLEVLADAGLELTQTTDTNGKPFDAYSVSIIGVMAVRHDVLLSIESGPMSDMAAKFIAVAAAKL